MRVLIDTNVLISAALSANSTPYRAYVKAASYPNHGMIANVKHFFTLSGKMFFTSYGKEFFIYHGKQIFTSQGKHLFARYGKQTLSSAQPCG